MLGLKREFKKSNGSALGIQQDGMRVLSSGYYPQPPDELVSLTIHGRDRATVHTDFYARSFWSLLESSEHLFRIARSTRTDTAFARYVSPRKIFLLSASKNEQLGTLRNSRERASLSRIEGKNVSAVSNERDIRLCFDGKLLSWSYIYDNSHQIVTFLYDCQVFGGLFLSRIRNLFCSSPPFLSAVLKINPFTSWNVKRDPQNLRSYVTGGGTVLIPG